jgi:hypothetical protein
LPTTGRILAETHANGGPRNLPATPAQNRACAAQNENLLKKNLPGRPYSAPAVARLEFCYHSLQEDQLLYTTLPDAQTTSPANRSTTLEFGDSLRISEPLQARKPLLRLFLRQSAVVNEFPFRIKVERGCRRYKIVAVQAAPQIFLMDGAKPISAFSPTLRLKTKGLAQTGSVDQRIFAARPPWSAAAALVGLSRPSRG